MEMNAGFELIPAIDLKGGKCVRLQEGEMLRSTVYGDDPLAMALHWEEQGAERLHLVDLDGAFGGEPRHLDLARSIFRALRIPVQFGGGLRTLDQLERILELGAARAILGTVAVESPEVVEEAVKRHGEAVVVGIDARGGRAALRGWVDQTALPAVELARRVGELGVRRIIYTDVSRDGMLCGANHEETARLARQTGLAVIASGGVTSSEDVRELWERRSCGIEGVILGRSLYEKKINYRDLRLQVALWS
jgi:phosphoribosylformimino-5-aminoimidazole carboxamide ribotide isomerase